MAHAINAVRTFARETTALIRPARLGDTEMGKRREQAETWFREAAAQTSPADQERFLATAHEGYEEQDRRADRCERRATTLLSAITIVTTLVGAVGALLASSDVLRAGAVRWIFGVGVAVVIVLFGIAAAWALVTLTSMDKWVRPSTPPMLHNRAERAGRALYVDYGAALYDSVRRNQAMADRQISRVRYASRFFGAGLAALLVLAVGFTIAGTAWPSKRALTGRRGPQGVPGVPGEPGRSMVQKTSVRVILAVPVLRGRAHRLMVVRYVVTKPGKVTLSYARAGRAVVSVPDSAAFGVNRTVVLLPGRGRYLLSIEASAADGTSASDDAPLIVS